MKRIFTILFFMALFIVTPVYANGIKSSERTVSISTGKKTVNIITVDLNNPNIEIFPVLANNKVNTAAPLYDVAESYKSTDYVNVAAVNGDFFASYDGTNLPYGISMSNGSLFHAGAPTAVVGFDASLNTSLARVGVVPVFTTTKADGKTFEWEAWGINHIFAGYDGEIVLYTSYYGNKTAREDGISFVVRNGSITEIIQGDAPIYSDGYTIYTNNANKLSDRLTIGDKLSFIMQYRDADNGSDLGWQNIKTMLSGGPMLIQNGQSASGYETQGFTDPKITTNKAQRSFLIITNDKKLIVGTVGSTTMDELRELAFALDAKHAINLDGGASSGLYMNGSLITTPGRNLTNVIIMRERKAAAAPKTNVKLHGAAVKMNNEILNIDGRTYCPVRDITDALGLTIGWKQDTQEVTVTGGLKTAVYKIDSDFYLTDGISLKMDAKPFIDVATGRTYLPIRYIAEPFGYKVGWEQKTATITIE